MKVRKAKIEDALDIATIQVLSSRNAYREIMSKEYLEKTSITMREFVWKKILEENDGEVILLDDNGTQGYIHFGVTRDSDKEKTSVAEIMSIYIYPESQRLGYGTRLVRYVLENLAENFKELNLWVLDENFNAKKFYEKMNFTREYQKEVEIDGYKKIEVRYIRNLN